MLEREALLSLSRRLTREPDNYMHSFRENVRIYLDEKDITLAEVAEAADIPESTLKSFVYGKSTDCHLSTAIKLAKVFKVSVDELVGCGTIGPITMESLQITRQLPECYTNFVRWTIRTHQELLNNSPASVRAVEVMNPEIGAYGNLKLTNDFEILDISELNDDIRPKITMGIRIPNNQYTPIYNKNDILLIANDRQPYPSEVAVMCSNDNIWFLKSRKMPNGGTKLCAVRDNVIAPPAEELSMTFGYVVKVIKSMKLIDDDEGII